MSNHILSARASRCCHSFAISSLLSNGNKIMDDEISSHTNLSSCYHAMPPRPQVYSPSTATLLSLLVTIFVVVAVARKKKRCVPEDVAQPFAFGNLSLSLRGIESRRGQIVRSCGQRHDNLFWSRYGSARGSSRGNTPVPITARSRGRIPHKSDALNQHSQLQSEPAPPVKEV